MDFGTRLRQRRELRKMTQEQLAEAAGMPPSQVSHYETNSREPSLSNLLRLASDLRFTPGNLLPRSTYAYAVCDKCAGHGVIRVDRPTSILREKAGTPPA